MNSAFVTRQLSSATALMLVALYLVAATRFFVPGLCVGMCAPIPAGEAASFNAIQACCATAMPMGGPTVPDSDAAASECAFCALLTAPGAPAALVVPADAAPHFTPARVAAALAAHSAQGRAPGMPRDPPFAAHTS